MPDGCKRLRTNEPQAEGNEEDRPARRMPFVGMRSPRVPILFGSLHIRRFLQALGRRQRRLLSCFFGRRHGSTRWAAGNQAADQNQCNQAPKTTDEKFRKSAWQAAIRRRIRASRLCFDDHRGFRSRLHSCHSRFADLLAVRKHQPRQTARFRHARSRNSTSVSAARRSNSAP